MDVRIEVVPWLTRAFGYRGAGRLTFGRAIAPDATLASLLASLVCEHPDFADYALAGDGSLACPHVCLTLNGQVIAAPAELGRRLEDGDVLVLLPAFAGGQSALSPRRG